MEAFRKLCEGPDRFRLRYGCIKSTHNLRSTSAPRKPVDFGPRRAPMAAVRKAQRAKSKQRENKEHRAVHLIE
jgi:hypothetical protein